MGKILMGTGSTSTKGGGINGRLNEELPFLPNLWESKDIGCFWNLFFVFTLQCLVFKRMTFYRNLPRSKPSLDLP